jgi:hypothetical protein
LQNSFERQQSAVPLFLLVDIFFGFAENSSEKWKAAICCFAKELCKNLGNVLTNRKIRIKLQKSIMHALFFFKRVL